MAPRVLFVTSECAPWSKTGGLADVSASLPAALRALGVDARVLTPAYPGIPPAGRSEAGRMPPLAALPEARIDSATLPGGVPAFLLECAPLYERPGGPYLDAAGAEWPDNARRFAQLARAASFIASGEGGWKPDVVHGNDWQGGLVPAYLREAGTGARTVVTIHNLAFQGIFPAAVADEVGLPLARHAAALEYHGKCSFLKAGLVLAHAITTVSPTYAAEILRDDLGMGMAGVLRSRGRDLHGILNGIDTAAWNPAADPHLAARYDAGSLERKRENRRALLERCGWSDAHGPLFGIVSRLTGQKGIDLVLENAAALAARGARLAVLGTGEPGIEAAVAALAREQPRFAWAHVGFDEALAHRIEAGADFFLMPSRFEPCGMNQMFSQRYGTPPIVRATGGLIDSVTPFDAASGTGGGFVFGEATAGALLEAIDRALEAFAQPEVYRRVQRNGMGRDFSWAASAARYRDLYASLTSKGRRPSGP